MLAKLQATNRKMLELSCVLKFYAVFFQLIVITIQVPVKTLSTGIIAQLLAESSARTRI